jgi:integrase
MAQSRHITYSLKPAHIDNAKPGEKPYSLTDGGGLHIEVLPGGSKVWRYKYLRDGKREKVTIGQYPGINIKTARDRHEELRQVLASGASPAKAKQTATTQRKQAQAGAVLFQDFAAEWLAETMGHLSDSYRAQTASQLDRYVYPRIGAMPLADVMPADVLAIVEAMRSKPNSAEIVRSALQRLFNYAIRKLVLVSNPATPIRGAVRVPPKTHHRHLNERELGAFWRSLGQQGAHAVTIYAARMLMLTMVRKSELLRSRWCEYDLDAAVWDIPAERMKMRQPHRVYLSRQALEVLAIMAKLSGHRGPQAFVFPSIQRHTVPLGDVTLNHMFKRMEFGVSDFSPHGTRGTAATLLREHGFGRDVVELLLAHKERNAVTAAYSHHELADERRRALQFLADRIDALAD